MSEYWKSLPKKYCDFCKCWITDNKASVDFHERGFKHQANVRKRVKDIQRNSTIQERERQKYNLEIAKIEAAALGSFQNDIARNPSLSKEIANSPSSLLKFNEEKSINDSKGAASFNRFGQSFGDESETLVNGKKRALETIAKAFEKKSKWLEAKTAEGSTYYWNKDSLETRHDPPKSGFLSLEEQNQFKHVPSASNGQTQLTHAQLSNQQLRGGWKAVETNDQDKLIDLQLPNQDLSQIMLDIKQSANAEDNVEQRKEEEPIVFKEKTVDSLKRPFSKGDNVSFKKRAAVKRNIRTRESTD